MRRTKRGRNAFSNRYGPWAIVAGASRGLGEAFARLLAEYGCNLILAARREGPLSACADELRMRCGIEVVTHALDLAEGASALLREIETREVGLIVYNAALAPLGPFLALDPRSHERVLAVNCRTPLLLTHAAAARMRQRGRGGIILVSSLAGRVGGPWCADYAASKSYLITLAESLWREWRGEGIDVIAPVYGAVGTPSYWSGLQGKKSPTPMLDPAAAALAALASLGKRGSVVPGFFNTLGAWFLTRVLWSKARLGIMAAAMRSRKMESVHDRSAENQ